jgi:hypothetical protein
MKNFLSAFAVYHFHLPCRNFKITITSRPTFVVAVIRGPLRQRGDQTSLYGSTGPSTEYVAIKRNRHHVEHDVM